MNEYPLVILGGNPIRLKGGKTQFSEEEKKEFTKWSEFLTETAPKYTSILKEGGVAWVDVPFNKGYRLFVSHYAVAQAGSRGVRYSLGVIIPMEIEIFEYYNLVTQMGKRETIDEFKKLSHGNKDFSVTSYLEPSFGEFKRNREDAALKVDAPGELSLRVVQFLKEDRRAWKETALFYNPPNTPPENDFINRYIFTNYGNVDRFKSKLTLSSSSIHSNDEPQPPSKNRPFEKIRKKFAGLLFALLITFVVGYSLGVYDSLDIHDNGAIGYSEEYGKPEKNAVNSDSSDENTSQEGPDKDKRINKLTVEIESFKNQLAGSKEETKKWKKKCEDLEKKRKKEDDELNKKIEIAKMLGAVLLIGCIGIACVRMIRSLRKPK